MKDYYQTRRHERQDVKPYRGYKHERCPIPDAEKIYRDKMDVQIKTHEVMIHIESGPIAYCDCETCENYRKKKKTGKFHQMHGCYCPYCIQVRYNKHKTMYGRETALKKKEQALIKAKNKRRQYNGTAD